MGDELTKVSDADVDRAATKSVTLPPVKAINLIKLHNVLRAVYSINNNTLHTPLRNEGETVGLEESQEEDRQLDNKVTATKRTVKAFWDLIDRDNDGMINQHEMDQVIQFAIQPIEQTFRIYVEEGLDACSLREPTPFPNTLVPE